MHNLRKFQWAETSIGGGADGDPSPRDRGIAVLNTDVAADTTISTSTNATGTFLDYSGVTFSTDVEIHINGVLMRCGASAGADFDVYPAGTAANGDFACEFNLIDTDVIQMFIGGGSFGVGDVTSDGTTAQDAALFAWRADHVNTPTAGYGEMWLRGDVNDDRPTFTNEDSEDFDFVLVRTDQTWASTALIVGTSNRGQTRTAENLRYNAVDAKLQISDANANIRMKEGTAPTPFSTYGHFWIKNDTPNHPMFTDGAGTQQRLVPVTGKTAPPDGDDDGASGYSVGTVWVDETNDDAYISLDATASNAVWKKITP
jgi:hypothetical protein